MFIIETIHTTNLEPGILDCHLKAVSLHPSTELLFMALADLILKQVHMWRRLTVATLAQLSTSRTCLSLRQIGSLQHLRYILGPSEQLYYLDRALEPFCGSLGYFRKSTKARICQLAANNRE